MLPLHHENAPLFFDGRVRAKQTRMDHDLIVTVCGGACPASAGWTQEGGSVGDWCAQHGSAIGDGAVCARHLPACPDGQRRAVCSAPAGVKVPAGYPTPPLHVSVHYAKQQH